MDATQIIRHLGENRPVSLSQYEGQLLYNWIDTFYKGYLNAILTGYYKIEALQQEIAALRPDALAWREREARYQAEKQELEKRMGR